MEKIKYNNNGVICFGLKHRAGNVWGWGLASLETESSVFHGLLDIRKIKRLKQVDVYWDRVEPEFKRVPFSYWVWYWVYWARARLQVLTSILFIFMLIIYF